MSDWNLGILFVFYLFPTCVLDNMFQVRVDAVIIRYIINDRVRWVCPAPDSDWTSGRPVSTAVTESVRFCWNLINNWPSKLGQQVTYRRAERPAERNLSIAGPNVLNPHYCTATHGFN